MDVTQRQDSLTDQLDSVAEAAESAARWLRSGGREGQRPPLAVIHALGVLAVGLGCYDAHDWLLRQQKGASR
jgi:hypothetical protein